MNPLVATQADNQVHLLPDVLANHHAPHRWIHHRRSPLQNQIGRHDSFANLERRRRETQCHLASVDVRCDIR